MFLRERNPDRPYDLHRDELRFDWQVLPGIDFMVRNHWVVLNHGVRRAVGDADVVVLGGWNQPAFLEALASSRLRRAPSILWSESTGRDERTGRYDPFKRVVLRTIDGFVVPGVAAHDYLRSLGVAEERITTAPNAVDPTIFGSAHRTRGGGTCRVLAVARLAPEKGLDVLVEAAAGLPVEVVIAGTGPEEDRLRELAGPNVTFLGYVERDALPALYADADVAVVPSRSDPWGMVLNEAALAGLPLVSTTAAGGASDLVENDGNGFLVPPGDVDALRASIARLAEDEDLRRRAGARSLEIASRFTPDAWADAVAAAVAQRSPA